MTLKPIPGAPPGTMIPAFPGSLSQHDDATRQVALGAEMLKQAEWLKRIDANYPPPREVKTIAIEPKPKRGPTERRVMAMAENDPIVIQFLTDMLGPMVGIETADRIAKMKVSGYYGSPYELSDSARAAYGTKVCVWAPADESWVLVFQGDDIDLVCKTQPANADLRKLIFVIGWWEIRINTHHTQGGWRRLGLKNVGELMRDRRVT